MEGGHESVRSVVRRPIYPPAPLRECRLANPFDRQASSCPAHKKTDRPITIDDGHRSVYDVLRPLLRDRHWAIPITLFIYPSAISNASDALTWEELRTMKQDGFFTIESHAYWHPNFRSERALRDAASFRAFVLEQLVHARSRVSAETGATATCIAWPFGIHDTELEALAVDAGYVAGFTSEPRPVTRAETAMALPRYPINDVCGEECIWGILRETDPYHN
ncbi:polysaccharide deacetylase family protein [Cupriavidus sp. SW-Y-13]|uniref:polysaccharide deacetylase family protein n=1 Tax=Cupriavidus sp. SW-Y-13 TaxID=2653854 RepID=UPI001365B0BC|nr:polysaccharide deacetylase family protein [Cupriavidus sp. SW-Y-13]